MNAEQVPGGRPAKFTGDKTADATQLTATMQRYGNARNDAARAPMSSARRADPQGTRQSLCHVAADDKQHGNCSQRDNGERCGRKDDIVHQCQANYTVTNKNFRENPSTK